VQEYSRVQVRSYRDLTAWQRAIELVEAVYLVSGGFPREELYGLTSQIRRAAVSVAANIAEGYGRDASGSYAQFLRIARGSLREVETLMIIAGRVNLATREEIAQILELCDEEGRILHGLIRSLGVGQ
jgi:four helix bundle protein